MATKKSSPASPDARGTKNVTITITMAEAPSWNGYWRIHLSPTDSTAGLVDQMIDSPDPTATFTVEDNTPPDTYMIQALYLGQRQISVMAAALAPYTVGSDITSGPTNLPYGISTTTA